MKALFSVLQGSFRAELIQLLRARLFVALTIIQAVTFLVLVSLFGLTGSRAPTAITTSDHGAFARAFMAQLAAAHHSFDLRPMDEASALAALHRGSLVAIITLPSDFSDAIAQGQEVSLEVAVDNVNTDMTDDIQRALPSAIVAFGRQLRLPGIRVHVREVDLLDHDTGFVPYLVVSGLALDAFVITSILSAMAVAREFETRTIKLLAVAPVHPLLSLVGRMLATDTIASIAMVFPVTLAVFGYGVSPLHPLEMVGVMLLCVAIFGCIGVALGAVLRRTLPVVSLVFGLGFPLYLCSGSLEPQRFDGNLIWVLAHLSPVYYAVGILEQAFHGLQVTPEPLWVNFTVLFVWSVLMLLVAGILLRTALIEKTARQRVGKQRPILVGRHWRWQQPRIALPQAIGLFTGLILLVIGAGIWFREQYDQMDILLRQQQLYTTQVAAEQQREIRLLNGYKQNISFMLIHGHLLSAKATEPAGAAVSARTQELLRQLNCEHKAELLRFLSASKLIDDDFHVVSLLGDDFYGCRFAGFDLTDTDLTGANFSNADMHNSKFTSSTLVAVNFSNANLAGADLRVTDMHYASMINANLAGADLSGVVGVSIEQLLHAHSLAGARLPDGSVQPGEVKDTD
jgi:ABC-2 type transport system permease protein